jgi:copper(I)-binding protein
MFRRIARYTLLPSLLALLLLPAAATASDLEIANAWATLPEAWENSSVYFVIQSKSKKTRTLVGASGSCCDFIEIRRAVLKDGAMDSEKQDKIEIPAGGAVAFVPRGLYLNLAGLETLAVGEAVTIELEFADGGKLEFDAIGRDD